MTLREASCGRFVLLTLLIGFGVALLANQIPWTRPVGSEYMTTMSVPTRGVQSHGSQHWYRPGSASIVARSEHFPRDSPGATEQFIQSKELTPGFRGTPTRAPLPKFLTDKYPAFDGEYTDDQMEYLERKMSDVTGGTEHFVQSKEQTPDFRWSPTKAPEAVPMTDVTGGTEQFLQSKEQRSGFRGSPTKAPPSFARSDVTGGTEQFLQSKEPAYGFSLDRYPAYRGEYTEDQLAYLERKALQEGA